MRRPYYSHERNYGCRITETIYRGLRTVTLENEMVRVSFLADKGTDIFEFLHKPTDTDFMWRSPLGVRNPAMFVPTIPRPEGAFLDYYEGGWQECLPTGGNPAEYAGTKFGPHGEVCLVPWDYTILENEPERVQVRYEVRTYRTPCYLQKTVTLERNSGVLAFSEQLTNEGAVPLDLMWGHHPAFGPPFLDESCVIDLPGATVRTIETEQTGRCKPGAEWSWPRVPGKDGPPIDLGRIAPPETRAHDLAILTDLQAGWYAITNTTRRVGFGMVWPVATFGALWYWQVFGGAMAQPWYGRTYNIALEPWTTPHLTIEEAIAQGTQRVLAPGEALELEFKAVAYAGIDRVLAIGPDGAVTPATG
jgi:hypothetical protein